MDNCQERHHPYPTVHPTPVIRYYKHAAHIDKGDITDILKKDGKGSNLNIKADDPMKS